MVTTIEPGKRSGKPCGCRLLTTVFEVLDYLTPSSLGRMYFGISLTLRAKKSRLALHSLLIAGGCRSESRTREAAPWTESFIPAVHPSSPKNPTRCCS